jgi:cyclase
MLTRRIIPCLDINEGRVVKGVNFVNLRDAGDPVENAKVYEREGADELVFLDITASVQKRKTVVDLVKSVAQVVFMPFTVGGGIKETKDMREILWAGADKVSVNTQAVKKPSLITQGAKMFGSQCIVLAIDAKCCYCDKKIKKWEVYINGGRTPTGIDAVDWAKTAQKLGAGEILLTSMDYDGTKDGFDIELCRAVSSCVTIPVIASGGAGKPSHFYNVFAQTKVTAGLAASIFHYREYEIKSLKRFLSKKGVRVRI